MKLPPVSDQATLAELAGYKMKAHRLKKLAEYDPQDPYRWGAKRPWLN